MRIASTLVAVALVACGSTTGTRAPDAEVITLTSIALTPATLTVERGLDRPKQLTAMATYSDTTTRDVTTELTWTSSAPTIATVDSGLVTFVGPGAATITGGFGSESATSGTAQVTISDPTLAVASLGGSPPGIDFFPAFASGNVAPTRSIRGNATTLVEPWEILVVGQELFVADISVSEIVVFPVNGSGNVAPIRKITGVVNPYGLAAFNNELYVGQSNSQILVFPLTADGNVAPTRTIAGVTTALTDPLGLTVFNNELYVMNEGASNILVFPVTANGDVAPTRTISGALTTLSIPLHAVFDGNEMFVSNFGRSAITTFLPTASGNVAPLRNIIGPDTQLASPEESFIIGDELFVTSSNNNSIQAQPARATGDSPPTRVLGGAATLINSPHGLAVF